MNDAVADSPGTVIATNPTTASNTILNIAQFTVA